MKKYGNNLFSQWRPLMLYERHRATYGLFLSCSGTCLHRCIFFKELTKILKLKTQGWSLNFIFNPTWAWKSEANSTSTWKSNGKLNFHGFQFTQPFSTTICVFKTILNTYANHKTPCSNKGSNTQTFYITDTNVCGCLCVCVSLRILVSPEWML